MQQAPWPPALNRAAGPSHSTAAGKRRRSEEEDADADDAVAQAVADDKQTDEMVRARAANNALNSVRGGPQTVAAPQNDPDFELGTIDCTPSTLMALG